jgi:hypothetical protein
MEVTVTKKPRLSVFGWFILTFERPRFVFDVDEIGCSEHIDSHEATAVLPIDYPDPSVPLPVDHNAK